MPSVLIIDDEEPIAWGLRRAFEREKYRVGVAATAEDGLAQARARPPDVVFLDVRLPDGSGVEVCRAVREKRPAMACLMLTNPNTLGLFDERIEEIAEIVHGAGGTLYYDGANLNAVMGIKLNGDDFVVTLETAPRADAPARQVTHGRGHGAVTDLRWHGKAGLARTTKSQWKLKPGRA